MAAWILAAAAVASMLAHDLGVLPGPDTLFTDWLYDTVEGVAALVCIAAGIVRRPDRAALVCLGAALAVWTVGDVIDGVAAELPVPSVADAFWIAFYPLAYAGLALLLRRRVRDLPPSAWLDGLIAALAVASVTVGAALTPALEAQGEGGTLAFATNVAYPLGDAGLLGMVAGLAALTGGRPGRRWTLLGGALALTALADALYAGLVWAGIWDGTGPLGLLWPVATVLTAAAAWSPDEPRVDVRPEGLRAVAVPLAAGLLAIGVLAGEDIRTLNPVASVLAVSALLAVMLRLVLAFRENGRMMARLRLQASTDPLTGLANHREFHGRLEAEVDRARRHGRALSVAVVDIDRFKSVNDTHGHLVGDRVLRVVAERLRGRARPGDVLGRIGGDEIAWILPETEGLDAWSVVDRVRGGAGREPLPGVGRLTLSAGVCDLEQIGRGEGGPDLLRRADSALYWAKAHGRDACFRYSHEVAAELAAGGGAHDAPAEAPPTAGELAERMAERLGWDEEDRRRLRRAADGDAEGPGSLDAVETAWRDGRRERWDGAGGPVGLRGADIPEGARLLAVADAVAGMLAGRGGGPSASLEEALAECRAASGRRFAPDAVEALLAVAGGGLLPPAPHR
jgi:diguanylate cyclase (GGDEF)-like protein